MGIDQFLPSSDDTLRQIFLGSRVGRKYAVSSCPDSRISDGFRLQDIHTKPLIIFRKSTAGGWLHDRTIPLPRDFPATQCASRLYSQNVLRLLPLFGKTGSNPNVCSTRKKERTRGAQGTPYVLNRNPLRSARNGEWKRVGSPR